MVDIKIFLIYFIFLNIFISCRDGSKGINNNIKKVCFNSFNSFSFNDYSYNTDFEPSIIDSTINIGEVQNEDLKSETIYKYTFMTDGNFEDENDVFVYFYPLDCQIKIAARIDNEYLNITKINNYEYDAFLIVVKGKQRKDASIKIMPLINQLDSTNKYRVFHLSISSFENKENPQLVLKEQIPTFIYFNDNLNNLKIQYNIKDNKNENPVTFSFFIKEKAQFEFKVLDEENIKLERIIDYKDIIVVNNELLNGENSISILINKNNIKNSTMIIKVIEDNSIPFYLQKNILNWEFLPINVPAHYYYIEIFQGEEGEIMLHHKRFNGILISKIVGKNDLNESQVLNNENYPNISHIYDYLEDNSYLEFDIYSQKLSFSSSQVYECKEGCYLLITYYPENIGLENIEVTEYTLMSRIWKDGEYKSQIIFIPLNEYIFGTFSQILQIGHYYSVYIPEDNDVILEIHGYNILAYATKDIVKINMFKPEDEAIDLVGTQKEIIYYKLSKEDFGLKSLKDQYISFLFLGNLTDHSDYLMPFYYFRIAQKDSNKKYIIYPLDTNKENFCKSSKNNNKDSYVCYYLLKNYNINNYIYAYGINEIIYNVWYINQSDYYSNDINEIKSLYEKETLNNGYLHLSYINYDYILVEIESSNEEYIKVFHNFEINFTSNISLDIFSFQMFYLNENIISRFTFNYNLTKELTFLVKGIKGKGFINLNNNNLNKKLISEKLSLTYSITKELQNIYLETDEYFIFYAKLYYRMNNDMIDEINYGFNYKNDLGGRNILAYYVKDIYNEGLDINFYFGFNEENDIQYTDKSIYIKGYAIEYEKIKDFSNEDNLIYYFEYAPNLNDGLYDIGSKSGIIMFNKDYPQNKDLNDIYYLIIIVIKNNIYYYPFPYISLEIYVNPRNNPDYILPMYKYIRGSFNYSNDNDNGNKNQTFYIQAEKENNENETYILEYSSNFKFIELNFNDFSYDYSKETSDGVKLYYFSNLKKYNNFTVLINKIKMKNKELIDYAKQYYTFNYLIKFYKNLNKENHSYIIDKNVNLKFKNDTKEKLIYYEFEFQNNYPKINVSSDYYYDYYIVIYLKHCMNKEQILNTTSTIFYLCDYHFIDIKSNDINDVIKFRSPNLAYNEEYFVYLFITVSNKIDEEKEYYSKCFQIRATIDPPEKDSKIYILFIVLIIVFVIALIIFFIICRKIKRKNKKLEERVEAITFSSGVEEQKEDKERSKNEEDYETTFI